MTETTRAGHRLHRGAVTKAGCALALLLCARVAVARNAQETAPATATEPPAQAASAAPTPEPPPAVPPTISYVGGQLKIDGLDSTLADVLTRVAALTGVKIDVPAAANSTRMPIVKLGPGPAREVLASLLSDSNFDYLIQASDTDPARIQSVMVMPREKKGGKTNGTDVVARASRSPYARAVAPPSESEEAPVPDSPVPAQPEAAAADVSPVNPQPAPTQPDQSAPLPSAEPGQAGQPGQLNGTRVAPQAPPQSMDPQTINQQLQQMYQQRIQINQQEHQTVPPAAPANSGSN